MGSMWYWWVVVLLFIVAQQQTQARRRRQMGPRIAVEPSEFLRLVEQDKGLVIQGKKIGFLGLIMYVSRCGDYYYYTQSKTPLSLPEECEVQQAQRILL